MVDKARAYEKKVYLIFTPHQGQTTAIVGPIVFLRRFGHLLVFAKN